MLKLFEANTSQPNLRLVEETPELINEGPEDRFEPDPLSTQEIVLTAQLRAEANEEKDAFGWHAFQALSIASVALGGILYFMFSPAGFPAVGLAALPILVFALVTCRLGDSCYSSANRHYAYELFLYRVRTIGDNVAGRWKPEYRSIEWEAAMRAWRLVQTSLFEAIYKPGNYVTIDKLRPRFDIKKRAYWFCQSSLSRQSGAKFHAGTYLSRMHAMLLLVSAAAAAILVATVPAVFFRPFALADQQQAGLSGLDNFPHKYGSSEPLSLGLLNGAVFWLCLIVALGGLFLLIVRYRAEKAKRLIMEDQLLSIHASAIVWQAVVVAHFSALKRARDCGLTSWKLAELCRQARRSHPKEWKQWRRGLLHFEKILALLPEADKPKQDVDGAGLSGYTFWLGEEASSLARCAIDVPGWVGLGEVELRRRGIV